MSLAELREQYEVEDKKFQEVRNRLVEQDTKLKALEDEWEDMVVQMYPTVSELFGKEPEDIETSTEADVKALAEKIVSLLKDSNYKELVRLAQRADFALGNREERKEMNLEHQCMYYITLLKSYFIHSHTDPNLVSKSLSN